MTDSLEHLQAMDQHVEYVLQLLTQAEQSLEQVHAWAQEYQQDNPDPHGLMTAIESIRHNVHNMTDAHNQLLGQIRMAQHDAAEQAAQIPENPY
ncbi:MAG TPA: hypothetical protein VN636_15295 [Acidimicrobiia bacterium]|nr:hypothetical protein [Acidimicrobiia bacterium]